MIVRRLLALLVVTVGLVGACSSPNRPPIERVTGRIGASDGATVGGGATGGAASGSSATGAGDWTVAAGSAADGGSGGPTGSAAGSSADAAAGQAATAALNAYFDALQAEDFVGAQRASSGGPAFMARVRDVVSRYNKERDGVTTLAYASRSFQIASDTATTIAFTGQAKLDSTTSGPAGEPRLDSAVFENPTVSLRDGAWRVSDLRFDGQPLGYFPATSHKLVGGVDLRMPGALSFGKSTGLIVDLVSDGDHSIKVDKATLHYADGSTGVPKLGALVSKKPAALYFLFDRTSSPPTSWTATVTIDGGTSKQATANVTLGF